MTSPAFTTSEIPDDLARRMADRAADVGVDGPTWLRQLPGIVTDRLRSWNLTRNGSSMNGHNALVLPVVRNDEEFVLKISWPHQESAIEHLGLRHWAGQGAVGLIAAHPAQHALLLEALHVGVDLTAVDIDQACRVIGALLGRLNVEPPRTVPAFTSVVAAEIAAMRGRPPTIPRRWIDRALRIYDNRRYEPRLLHLDLHFENVLAADREPGWLAIDPKPVSGPPGFEIYPALRNRVDEYGSGSTFHWQVQQRLSLVAEAARIDLDDAREWSLVHSVINAHEAAVEQDVQEVSFHLAVASVLAEPW